MIDSREGDGWSRERSEGGDPELKGGQNLW